MSNAWGWLEEAPAMVPVKPTEAMLRPFYNCPPEELELAYQAMLAIAKAEMKRREPQSSPQEKP